VAGNKILPGYLFQLGGGKNAMCWDHPGPASYVNSGTYSTSGETINAIDLGLGGFDGVWAAGDSADGLYFVVLIPKNGGDGNAIPSYTVHWFVRASGAEVANTTNLSASLVRLVALTV
jgi:hypothetical protein